MSNSKETKIQVKIPAALADIISRLAKEQGLNEKRLAGYLLDRGFRNYLEEARAKNEGKPNDN